MTKLWIRNWIIRIELPDPKKLAMKSFTFKHILILTILLVSVIAYSSNVASNYVYICKGSGSYAYHYNPNCRGLRKCSTSLEKITLEEAKSKGRKLCGYED